jgi:predicted dehydrogenase
MYQMQPVRAAIIGTGTIAAEHATAIEQLAPTISLVRASDVDTGRLKIFQDKFQLADVTTDPRRLISDKSIDLIIVATPPSLHEPYVIDALESGKFVLCEKPLAHTLDAALRINRFAERFPGRLTVGHQIRYSHEFQRLEWLCKNKALGELRAARVERHSYIPRLHDAVAGSWWGKWNIAGGGVVITQMIHELDLLISLFGKPLSVQATMDTTFTKIESEDAFEASVTFSNGRSALCRGSVNSSKLDGCFEIQGSLGIAGLSGKLKLNTPDEEWRAIRDLNRSLPRTKPPKQGPVSRIIRAMKTRLNIQTPGYMPHIGFYEALVDSIRRGHPIPIPPVEALNSLDLCIGIYESAITGRPAQLPVCPTSPVFTGITPELYKSRARTENFTASA